MAIADSCCRGKAPAVSTGARTPRQFAAELDGRANGRRRDARHARLFFDALKKCRLAGQKEVFAMRFSRKVCQQALAASCCAALVSGTADADPAPYNLLPLLSVERNRGQYFANPVSGYVRLWIEQGDGKCVTAPNFSHSRPSAASTAARDYRDEKRPPVERFIWGRNYSRILQAKLVVTRSHVVSETVSLAEASHASSGHEGETWNSRLGDRQFLTPYFRVDQGTTAAIDVSISATKEAESSLTRNLLSVVEAGAKLIAPTGPLVTALNSDRLTQTSDFIDQSISKLFHEKIVESSANDFSADRWLPYYTDDQACTHRQPIAVIRALFPMGSKMWDATGYRDLGSWEIYATDPIVSIFATEYLLGEPRRDRIGPCGSAGEPSSASSAQEQMPDSGARASKGKGKGARKGSAAGARRVQAPDRRKVPDPLTGPDQHACIAFQGLVPTRVLSLPVDDKLTLGEALRGDAGIAAAVQRYAAKDGKVDAQAIGREICNLIAERAEGIGLNQWDSAAAVWAFAWNGGLDTSLAGSIWSSGCLTAELGRRIRLTALVSPSSDPQRAVDGKVNNDQLPDGPTDKSGGHSP
jgi:hypothetical protein